jgi:hypothetical protein
VAVNTGLATGIVYTIAVSDTNVYIGGSFTNAGGNMNIQYITRWDGNNWQVLGTGLNGGVRAIATSGIDIYVGGWFYIAGGLPASRFACWHIGPVGIDDKAPQPDILKLTTNYPDPFNASININYQLAASGQVSLKVYDVMGQEVRKLVDEYQAAGIKTIQWDGKDGNGKPVVDGVYVYRLQAGDVAESRTMRLVR